MTMTAIVIQVNPGSLLVRDVSNNQEVQVNYRRPGRFNVGDRVLISYNGQMTFSIPPQITATSIRRIGGAHQRPPMSQMNAIILQTGRGFMLVWDLRENRLIRVDYSNTARFRRGQFVTIRYDTITLETPPRIIAQSIST